jgi:Uma2 family endonuclease
VREYWIVDPDKKEVTVYCFEKHDIADHDTYMADMTVKSKVFNGLEVKLAEIFTF